MITATTTTTTTTIIIITATALETIYYTFSITRN
jgi:hypothetical protein